MIFGLELAVLIGGLICWNIILQASLADAKDKAEKAEAARRIAEIGSDAELATTKALLKAATEKYHREAAISQGLAEELAALKAYDPQEIEKRLAKIREIRAAGDARYGLVRTLNNRRTKNRRATCSAGTGRRCSSAETTSTARFIRRGGSRADVGVGSARRRRK